MFFVSPWSRVITGQTLDVNGGEFRVNTRGASVAYNNCVLSTPLYLMAVGTTGAPTAPVSGSGRGDEQEVVLAVGRAVGGEVVEMPVLALHETHVAQVDHVHRHEDRGSSHG